MKNCYWEDTGLHQDKFKLLQKIWPDEGQAEGDGNEHFNLMVKATRSYIDLYNGDICQGPGSRRFFTYFVNEREYRANSDPYFNGEYQEYLYEVVEEMMDDYVVAAFEEQAARLLLFI